MKKVTLYILLICYIAFLFFGINSENTKLFVFCGGYKEKKSYFKTIFQAFS